MGGVEEGREVVGGVEEGMVVVGGVEEGRVVVGGETARVFPGANDVVSSTRCSGLPVASVC